MSTEQTNAPPRWRSIPPELRERPQWVCWKHEVRDGKPTKVPYNAYTSRRASVDDPNTWTTFKHAADCADVRGFDGIGFVFSADDPFCGLDLDGCVNGSGELHPGARQIVERLDSYSERSPSGTGVHVIVRARLEGDRHRTGSTPWGGKFEVYDSGRYFTFTGDRLHGDHTEERALGELLARFMPGPEPRQKPGSPGDEPGRSDAEVLRLAFESRDGDWLRELYGGGDADYPSTSEADLALLTALAFFAGRDSADQLERLVLGSGRMRDKLARPGYLDRTIATALDRTDFYTGSPGPVRTGKRGSRAAWPAPLGDAAYQGLAGEIISVIKPQTEADPVAILLQLLTAFGSAAGRASGWYVEADFHPPILNVILVGETAKARKGTGLGHVRRLMREADSAWTASRIVSGLVSGEGLIVHVRDALGDDEGVEDKRLLVIEQEFSSPLRVMQRQGNTLAATLRDAWDGRSLQTLAKKSPCPAAEPHVSIIGHITRDELRRELTDTSAANGFGNRFLFVCAKRARRLPEGGSLTEATLKPLAGRLKQRLAFATKDKHVLQRDDQARALWAQVYDDLSEGAAGLVGAVTARAEAQVMRLAAIYALLDGTDKIALAHLNAGLEVWRYCADSAAYVFGTALGDPLADQVLGSLVRTPEGLTRSDIRDLFSRNRSSDEITRALELLKRERLARCEMETTGGRPAERWYATT